MKIYTTICFLSLINLFSFSQEGKSFCDATFGKGERSTGNLPLLTTFSTTLELDEFQICGGGKFLVNLRLLVTQLPKPHEALSFLAPTIIRYLKTTR